MTARRIPTPAEQDLCWRLRALAHLVLACLGQHDLEAAERALRDALEAIEAAR